MDPEDWRNYILSEVLLGHCELHPPEGGMPPSISINCRTCKGAGLICSGNCWGTGREQVMDHKFTYTDWP